MPIIRLLKRPLQFSLSGMLVLLILVALLMALPAIWLLYPAPLDVRLAVQPYSFFRYDDGAGNLPLGAVVEITNFSNSTAWFLGSPGTPLIVYQELVDGHWESILSWTSDSLAPRQWGQLRPMESITIFASPISEKATEFRVGLAFTTERLSPTKAHWVFSPAMLIVKKGHDYFPEPKPGAQQDEQVRSLGRPIEFSQSKSGLAQ